MKGTHIICRGIQTAEDEIIITAFNHVYTLKAPTGARLEGPAALPFNLEGLEILLQSLKNLIAIKADINNTSEALAAFGMENNNANRVKVSRWKKEFSKQKKLTYEEINRYRNI